MQKPEERDYDKERHESFTTRMIEISKLAKHSAYIAGNIEEENKLVSELIDLCVKLKNDRVVAKMPRPLM
jgi:hypothetical protein